MRASTCSVRLHVACAFPRTIREAAARCRDSPVQGAGLLEGDQLV